MCRKRSSFALWETGKLAGFEERDPGHRLHRLAPFIRLPDMLNHITMPCPRAKCQAMARD